METKTKAASDNEKISEKIIGAYNSSVRSPLSLVLAIILTLFTIVGIIQIPLIITSQVWTNFIGFGVTLPAYITAAIAAVGLYKLRAGKGDIATNMRAQKPFNMTAQIYEILESIAMIAVCVLVIVMCAGAMANQADKATYLAAFKTGLLNGGLSSSTANIWYDLYASVFDSPVANLVVAIIITLVVGFVAVNCVITFAQIRKKYNRLAENYEDGAFSPDDKYPIVRPVVFGVLTVASSIIGFFVGGASGVASTILIGLYLVLNTFYFCRIHDGMLDRLGY